jgi:hypothetical protein
MCRLGIAGQMKKPAPTHEYTNIQVQNKHTTNKNKPDKGNVSAKFDLTLPPLLLLLLLLLLQLLLLLLEIIITIIY